MDVGNSAARSLRSFRCKAGCGEYSPRMIPCVFIRIGEEAGNLFPLDPSAQEGEGDDRFITVLRLRFGKINAARITRAGVPRF